MTEPPDFIDTCQIKFNLFKESIRLEGDKDIVIIEFLENGDRACGFFWIMEEELSNKNLSKLKSLFEHKGITRSQLPLTASFDELSSEGEKVMLKLLANCQANLLKEKNAIIAKQNKELIELKLWDSKL